MEEWREEEGKAFGMKMQRTHMINRRKLVVKTTEKSPFPTDSKIIIIN